MERIVAADQRVLALSALLTRPTAVHAPSEPVVDPQVALEAERARIFEQARNAGHAAGLKQAEAEIAQRAAEAERSVKAAHAAETAQLAQSKQRLARLLDAVPDAVAEFDEQLEASVVEATFAAVTRVLGELAAERDLIVRVCEQALAECRQRPAVLRVGGDAVELVSELAGDELRVLGDDALPPGQCRIETASGRYETSLELRLEALKQALLRSLSAGAA